MKKRVVITGMGAITPVGNNVPTFWNSLIEGKSGTKLIEGFDTEGLPVKIGAEITNFDPLDYLELKEAKRMDRVCQFGMAAANQAVEDSKIAESNFDPARIAVVTGSGIGGIDTLEKQHTVIMTKKPKFVSPLFIPMLIPDIIPGHIAMKWNFMGPNYSVASACATGSHAIGIAYRHILSDDCDVIVTGGTEASITPLALAGFSNMKALSKRNDDPARASRPFDKTRDGFVMGEGAGMLVLEELEHALKRGANIYAEIVGYGFSADAYHITSPHPEGRGQKIALASAIRTSGLPIEDFQYLNAHGTSTPLNDKYETITIKKVFGENVKNINISSIKSMTGHLLGAAGGAEAIALAMSLREQIVPPTINYEFPDPECDLNYTPNKAVKREIKAGLSMNFGFGGHNAALALKKYD